MRPVQRDIEGALEGVLRPTSRLSCSGADILAHREAHGPLVEHDGVEPTNNYAELDLSEVRGPLTSPTRFGL